MKLIISMESTCDMSKELIEKYDFKIIDMNYYIDGVEYSSKTDTVQSSGLYEKMKNKAKTSTSALNPEQYYDFFKQYVNEDAEWIHLAFSSGLSGTYTAAYTASALIYKDFKKRIHVVDSLCACSGQGLLGIILRDNQDKYTKVEDLLDFIENMKRKLNHQFTVSNLRYLANGGRLSKGKALIGNILSIKPVLYMNGLGKLIATKNVISRKASLDFTVNKYEEIRDKDYNYCIISGAGCDEDSKYVADRIEKDLGIKPIITDLGPIIGAHSGPGTLAIYFVGPFRDTQY